jgi:hypothetical protein
MGSLTAHDILQLWEQGQYQHPINQALSMLALARPDMTREDLSRLDIAQRDQSLLDLREQISGPYLQVYSECPDCSAGLEFSVTTSELKALDGPQPAPDDGIYEMAQGEVKIRFRLPNSTDLAAAIGADTTAACALIMQRCVIEARRGDMLVRIDEQNDEFLRALADYMGTCASQADIVLDILCPACRFTYQAQFDIASFLWKEISSQAMRLLRDVHTLARAYGWREADILSMSAARRAYYLEMAG